MSTATLWSYEYVANQSGHWDRAWFATEAEARASHAARVAEGFDPESDMDGSYGDLGEVESVPIELSAEGALRFAQQYACLPV